VPCYLSIIAIFVKIASQTNSIVKNMTKL